MPTLASEVMLVRAGEKDGLWPAGAIESLVLNVYRWFTEGQPLAEPIDLYPEPAVAGPGARQTVLEALVEKVETVAAGGTEPGDPDDRPAPRLCPTDIPKASATVADLRQAAGFPDALLRRALDLLGKERLVRVEVHTLSRRFRRRPRHELRFHITAHGCSHPAKAGTMRQNFRPDSGTSLRDQSS